MGPTWAQHGANMGSKKAPRSVQGGSNCFPEGVHQLRLLSDRPHGPQMNPKLGSSWDHLGVILGSSWGRLRVILGSSWGHFGITLGSLWDHFEVTLGSHWDRFGVTLAPFWYQRFSPTCRGADFGSRVKSSGNLRGQSEQNFEIYTVDWSQVSGWGLAAGGEALR